MFKLIETGVVAALQLATEAQRSVAAAAVAPRVGGVGQICPVAPEGAQALVDTVLGWFSWTVLVALLAGVLAGVLFIAIGRAFGMARMAQGGLITFFVLAASAIAYLVVPGLLGAVLGDGWDIEIVEMHHRMKADAPSGTALALGEAAAGGRGKPLKAERGRDGTGLKRGDGAIGFASLRGGTVAGDHDVIFAGPEERLILSHRAESRMIFARGALAAARFLHRKPAGLYSMRDVVDSL